MVKAQNDAMQASAFHRTKGTDHRSLSKSEVIVTRYEVRIPEITTEPDVSGGRIRHKSRADCQVSPL